MVTRLDWEQCWRHYERRNGHLPHTRKYLYDVIETAYVSCLLIKVIHTSGIGNQHELENFFKLQLCHCAYCIVRTPTRESLYIQYGGWVIIFDRNQIVLRNMTETIEVSSELFFLLLCIKACYIWAITICIWYNPYNIISLYDETWYDWHLEVRGRRSDNIPWPYQLEYSGSQPVFADPFSHVVTWNQTELN